VRRYIAIRAVHAIPVLLGITFVGFFLIHLVPGDPVKIILGIHATAQAERALRQELGLDKPLIAQYFDFLKGSVHFDFGESITQRTPVSTLLLQALAPSLFLITYSVVISIILAVPLAIISALKRNRPVDHAIRVLSMVTMAMPAFWTGLLLILLVSVRLGVLPTAGYGTGPVGHLKSLTLPAITLGLYLTPILLRSLRSSILETLSSEFIQTARAHGLSERRLVLKHVLRNSLMSTVTILGVTIGFLLSGTVVVENVFALPGLGSLLVTSIAARDFPTIAGLTVVFGVVVVIVNLLTDLSYAAIDPRVRL
jgi:peptide/nickel transport system permease protein